MPNNGSNAGYSYPRAGSPASSYFGTANTNNQRVYEARLAYLKDTDEVPPDSYLGFNDQYTTPGSVPVYDSENKPIGAIRGDGGWMPFTGTAQQTEDLSSSVPDTTSQAGLVNAAGLPEDTRLIYSVDPSTGAVTANYLDVEGNTQPVMIESKPWALQHNSSHPASGLTQQSTSEIATFVGLNAADSPPGIHYDPKTRLFNIYLPSGELAAKADTLHNKLERTPAGFASYYTAQGIGGGSPVVAYDNTFGSRPNLYSQAVTGTDYPILSFNSETRQYELTPLGQKLQKYNKIADPYHPGKALQTRSGMSDGLPALFDANSAEGDPSSEPLYIWNSKLNDFIASPAVATNHYNMNTEYTLDDNMHFISGADGHYFGYHQSDSDRRYPLMGPGQNATFNPVAGWTLNNTLDSAVYKPNGFTRAQIQGNRFQELTPEEALFQTGKLNTVRAEISKMPNAKLSWNDTNGITVINAVTKRPMGTVGAAGNVKWNDGINVGNTTATAPQDIWTVAQGLASTKAIGSNDFVNQNDDGSISIYSPVSGMESTLRPATSGGYELWSGDSTAPTITPITPAGEMVNQTTAATRLQQVSRGYTVGTYDPSTGLYPVLDADDQPAGNFNPYTGIRTWNTPVDPATATPPPKEEVAEDAEPKVDAPTLSNALQDPKVMEYLAYGIPIGAALGLAGYAIGGAKPGTLLPYLLGGAGGGALLGGLYGHYYGGEGTGTDTTEDLSAEALAALPKDQRIAILENRRWKENRPYTDPLTAEDVQNYSYAYVPKIGEFTYAPEELGANGVPNDMNRLGYTLPGESGSTQNYLLNTLPFAHLCMRSGGPVEYLGCRKAENGAGILNYRVRNPNTGMPCILYATYIGGDRNSPNSYRWEMQTAGDRQWLGPDLATSLFENSFKNQNPGRPFDTTQLNGDSNVIANWAIGLGFSR